MLIHIPCTARPSVVQMQISPELEYILYTLSVYLIKVFPIVAYHVEIMNKAMLHQLPRVGLWNACSLRAMSGLFHQTTVDLKAIFHVSDWLAPSCIIRHQLLRCKNKFECLAVCG